MICQVFPMIQNVKISILLTFSNDRELHYHLVILEDTQKLSQIGMDW